MSRDRKIKKYALEHSLTYQQAKQRLAAGPAAKSSSPAAPALGPRLFTAWEIPIADERRRALAQLAREAYDHYVTELRRGALHVFDMALIHAGVIQQHNVTVDAAYAGRLAEDLEDARGMVPHDETSLLNAVMEEPKWQIGANLYDALTDNDGELLDLVMASELECSVAPVMVDTTGTGPAAGRELLDALGMLAPVTDGADALGRLRRALGQVFRFEPAQPRRIGPMTVADAQHAYHRLLERADLGGSNITAHEAWMNAIPLLRNAGEPIATIFDLELCERAVWDLGAAALREIRTIKRTIPTLDLPTPVLANWPTALLEATREVPMQWRVTGATAHRTVSSWTAVVHEFLDTATPDNADAGEKAATYYGVARLCSELHAALRTAGIEYS